MRAPCHGPQQLRQLAGERQSLIDNTATRGNVKKIAHAQVDAFELGPVPVEIGQVEREVYSGFENRKISTSRQRREKKRKRERERERWRDGEMERERERERER